MTDPIEEALQEIAAKNDRLEVMIPDVEAAFGSVVNPKPYLTAKSIRKIAPHFNNPEFVETFMGVRDASHLKVLRGISPSDFLTLLSKSKKPQAKEILLNILTTPGIVSGFGQQELYSLVKYLGDFDLPSLKKILITKYSVSNLTNEDSYHWHTEGVTDLIAQYDTDDKFDILSSISFGLSHLLANGRTRPFIEQWIEEFSPEQKTEFCKSERISQDLLWCLGRKGFDYIINAVPQEELTEALSFDDISHVAFCNLGNQEIMSCIIEFLQRLSTENKKAYLIPGEEVDDISLSCMLHNLKESGFSTELDEILSKVQVSGSRLNTSSPTTPALG